MALTICDAYNAGYNYGVLQINRPQTHDNKGYIAFVQNEVMVVTMGILSGTTSFVISTTQSGGTWSLAGTGVILGYGQNTWSTTSDLRLKRDISTVENSLDKINGIRGVYFNYLADEPASRRRLGVIAQDLLEAVPEAVDQDESSGMYQVRFNLINKYCELILIQFVLCTMFHLPGEDD